MTTPTNPEELVDLLPCPFCGEGSSFRSDHRGGEWSHDAPGCFLNGVYIAGTHSIEQWNARAAIDATRMQVSEEPAKDPVLWNRLMDLILEWEDDCEPADTLARKIVSAIDATPLVEMREALAVSTHLLERYRSETPLGNQPHMIAHSANAAINVNNELLSRSLTGDRG